MTTSIAFLHENQLHIWDAQGGLRRIESPFVSSARARVERAAQKNAWKTQGSGAIFMGLGWPGGQQPAGAVGAFFTGLGRCADPSRLAYSLQVDSVSGMFTNDLAGEHEIRLMHGNQQQISTLSHHPQTNVVACAVPQASGASNIAVFRENGRGLEEVTEGDSCDRNPSWIPGSPKKLVFESAGVGRDASGAFLELGPSAINELDLERGDIRTLAEEPNADLLSPRVALDGTLYFLRSARAQRATGASPLRSLLVFVDLFLLPFRLIAAILGWLNFFTMRNTGKPLITSGNVKQRQADVRKMLARGNLVDAANEGEQTEENPARAGSQLIRQRADGTRETLAKNVVSFDLAPSGAVFFSDGAAVFEHTAEGPRRVFAAKVTGPLAVLEKKTA